MKFRSVLYVFLLLGHSMAVASIFGHWQVDVENSDDVSAILTEAAASGRKKPGWGWGGKKEEDAVKWRTPLPLVQAKKLLVQMQGEKLAIRPDIGKPVVFVPNQGAASVSLSGWGSHKQEPVQFGNWEGESLIIESALDEGTRVIQRYYIDPDGFLVQHTDIYRGVGEPIEIRRRFSKASGPGQEGGN